MTAKFIQPGNVLDYTAGGALASGAVVVIGVRVGVLLAALATGEVGPLQVTGVFNLAKLSTDVVAQGALLYWDAGNSRLTTTVGANVFAGYAAAAAGNGVATVNIVLNG